MRGRYITIEGCEGVGKSTQLANLKQYFETKGIEAVFTREPGGTPISEQIRSVILDPNNKDMTPTAELLLYAAARRQHTEQLVKTAIAQGKVVVCDRYIDSTTAYQGYARGLDLNLIHTLNRLAMGDVAIDMTLFLDLEPSKGFARKGGADGDDRMERESLAFHERVYQGYCAVAAANPERVKRIDASADADTVFARIVKALEEMGL